jgi:hypothetical protein
MKWRNYFCDDVKSGANLWDRNLFHAAISVNLRSIYVILIFGVRVFKLHELRLKHTIAVFKWFKTVEACKLLSVAFDILLLVVT